MEKKVTNLNNSQSIAALLIFACILTGLYFGIKKYTADKSQPQIEMPPTPKDMNSDEMAGMAIYTTNRYVTDQLKAPASADFQSNPEVKYVGDSAFIVKGYVDAQNSFGANIRSYYTAKVKYQYGDDKQKWKLLSLDIK